MKKIVLLSLSVFAAFSLFAQQPRDWAQYGRYERQNAALAGEPVEVVFMGNSITDNWIGADPDFFARNGFVDRGISGQTTAEMLARFRRDVIDLNPKAVVILAGINDIAQNNGAIKLENVFGNIVSMCELAKFNGIRVMLCSVLPCDRFSWRPEIKPAAAVAELSTPPNIRSPMWITMRRWTTAPAAWTPGSPGTAAIRPCTATRSWSRWSSRGSTRPSVRSRRGIPPRYPTNNR